MTTIVIGASNKYFNGSIFNTGDNLSLTGEGFDSGLIESNYFDGEDSPFVNMVLSNPSSTVEVNNDNRAYCVSKLRNGDIVTFQLDIPQRSIPCEKFSGLVAGIIYDFLTQLPLIEFYNFKTNEKETFHSAWLINVKYAHERYERKTLDSSTYFPTLPMFALYGGDGVVYNTLFNRYGHTSQWKNTLYDIGAISDELRRLGFSDVGLRHETNPTKKLKKAILRIAPRFKVTRVKHQLEYLREEKEFYFDNDDDYC